MRRRIFIAIPISEKLREEILLWEKKYVALPVRWLAGKNLHITLVPPWEANDKGVQAAIARMYSFRQGVRPSGGAEIVFNRVSYGPDLRAPRLIWAEGSAPEEIISIKKRLEAAFGTRNEYRPWLPHLTLARFSGEKFADFPVKNIDDRVEWHQVADRVALMESLRTERGADYKVLAEFPVQ